jgi:antitoxin component YwqK of YwqJK toxin-antitoxin module
MSKNKTLCGVIRIYYNKEKTKVKEEYFTMNGKKEGIYKSYHRNGKLKEEVELYRWKKKRDL